MMGRREAREAEAYAAKAVAQSRMLARALGCCVNCGERMTAPECEACAVVAQLEASITAARAGAVARRAAGTACVRCAGEGYESSFGHPSGYVACPRCGGSGCAQ
jgi:hypothetical protein